jgi:hypothetical protein
MIHPARTLVTALALGLAASLWSPAVAHDTARGEAQAPASLPAPSGSSSMSDSAYIARVSEAAPPAIVQNAMIVRVEKDGSMHTLQSGSNGFTCMLTEHPASPMCADKNAMAWAHALATHTTPPNTLGFVYMLAGDNGASNTSPYDIAPTAANYWIKTGPHVMIVGPSVTTMGYPMAPKADPAQPFVMWANTPYAHLMIPVAAHE